MCIAFAPIAPSKSAPFRYCTRLQYTELEAVVMCEIDYLL